jgi:TPR repeat protein
MMSYEARLIDHDLQIAIGGGGHGLTTETGSISNEHLERILRGVENGHKESIYFFALLKLYGISLPKDVTAALQNFRKASELGHAEAATAAGVMSLTGVGVEKDYATAIASFRRAVGLGDTNALWLLGK